MNPLHCVVAALLCLTLLTPAAAQQRTLRIGVEGAYPPFSEVGPDGKVKGFDIDIANALCAELKAQCTLVTQDFDGIIPSLLARKFDAVVASLSITEERKKAVDFTDKYYQSPNRMLARTGTLTDVTPAGLSGKRIGVQRTTIHDRFATETFKSSTIVRYAKQSEVYLDLSAGRLDAAIMDAVPADFGFLRKPAGKGFSFVGPAFNDPKYFGVGAGIAVRKGDKLREELNRAITTLRANGGYKAIQDKYFDFDIYGAAVK